MMKLMSLLVLVFLSARLCSQVTPAEGRELNYRIVGFSGPELHGNYEIRISPGNYNDQDSFRKHITILQKESSEKVMIEVPSFGKYYTWQVVSKGTGTKGVLHHFSTGIVPNADTAQWRLNLIKKAVKYSDGFVFLDGNRALYDMAGQPVWYLPDKENFLNDNIELRDLKMTPQGTITFLLTDKAYEVNYDGDILWRGPNTGAVSGDTSDNYHHEFTRLGNGHYMIMGNEFSCWRPEQNGNMSYVDRDKISADSTRYFRRVQMGIMIEYDEKGNVVWSWHLSEYFKNADLFCHIRRNGTPDVSVHDNAFFFDEKERVIYLSLRNLSRVIKIKYPEGTLLNEFGERFQKGVQEKFDGLFCREHCCTVSEKGYLYLFNNNVCHVGSFPKLIMIRQPAEKNGLPEKVWEYECTIESSFDIKTYGYDFTKGGSVAELPDGSVFACMGGTYSKVFIVDQEKKIQWSALPEKWDAKEKKWMPYYSYRASFITDRKVLGRLVWNN
jgi:Arylsulfotransferase (ASST)